MTFKNLHLIALALCTLPLAACDLLGFNDDARIAAAREAEGKAVGAACRYSQRLLEDCYGMNPKTSKAAIFAGWRDMDGYMRENQIASPEGPAGQQPAAPATEGEAKAVEAAPPAADAPKAAEAPAKKEKAAAGAEGVAPQGRARIA